MKLICLGLVLAIVIASKGLEAALGLWVVLAIALSLLAVAVGSKLPMGTLLSLALYPAVFSAFFALVAAQGPLDSAIIVARAVTSALAALLIVLTTPYPRLFAPFSRVLPPLVSDSLLMTYRSLFFLLDRFEHMRTAVRLRGGLFARRPLTGELPTGEPSTGGLHARRLSAREPWQLMKRFFAEGLMRTGQTSVNLLGGVLIYAIDLSQRTYDVMLLRGHSYQHDAQREPAAKLHCQNNPNADMQPSCQDGLGTDIQLGCQSDPDTDIQPSCQDGLGTRPDSVIVRVDNIRHRYDDGSEVALRGDFFVRRSQCVAILGSSGSGKTTLLHHILGLLRPQHGKVSVFGVDPSKEWRTIRSRIGILLQNVDEQILVPSVFDDVSFSARQFGLADPEVRERTAEALGLLGISSLAGRVPHNLSGGEKRKVALAGALVMHPELLVLDEPFESLDQESRTHVCRLLRSLVASRTAIVLTSHDIGTVSEFADYCYVLDPDGKIAWEGAPKDIGHFGKQKDIVT
ncbi:MAG: ATP-binding cassette domain-containing protein [Coriobacteriia bacterium]|nr:ATP-binding cassette domain-containing protein [Coriobacteriia bacterium]